MKKTLLAIALTAVAVSPAFAARHRVMNNDTAIDAYAYAAPNSDVVVDGGRVIGADPDLFIRGQLLREGDQTELNGP